jgi:hypothetical protein
MRRNIAAVVLAALLTTAGCGGSEPASTTTTTPDASPSVGAGMVEIVDQAKDVSDLMDQRNAAINDQLP